MYGQMPSLPSEPWNLCVVILLCGLMGWVMRLVRLMLIYLETYFAIQQRAVIHLEKLGPSLHVLQHASMWHFHQLLRTQLQIASTTMKRVRIPFEVVNSSVKFVKSADDQQPSSMNLCIEVKSETKPMVQVFWNVKASALTDCQSSTSLSTDRPLKRRSPLVLPTRAARTAIHAMRSLPGKFYDMDFTSTPHRLLEDDITKDNSERSRGTPKTRLNLTRLFAGADSFLACSLMERRKSYGPDEFVASIPSELLVRSGTQESVIQSSIVATDCEGEKAPDPVTPRVEDPRYSCVVAIGSADFFNSSTESKFPSFSLKKRKSKGSARLQDAVEEDALCQCVAIDFLPTPSKLSRTPVIVKKLNFTTTDVFASQDVFGRESNSDECVICLERPLAAILLPCRHFCVCRECLEEIDQCPICRAKFSTYACYYQHTRDNASASHLQLDVTAT